MKKNKKTKKKIEIKNAQNNHKSLVIAVLLLLVVFLGIGYAILTEQLTIRNTINYGSMKWNVGFTSIEDYGAQLKEILITNGEDVSNINFIQAATTISDDKKTITVSCDYGSSTAANVCVAKGTITNDSTFDAEIEKLEIGNLTTDISYLQIQAFLTDIIIEWVTNEEGDAETVAKGDVITAGDSKDFVVYLGSTELTPETIPTEDVSLTFDITIDWKQIEE